MCWEKNTRLRIKDPNHLSNPAPSWMKSVTLRIHCFGLISLYNAYHNIKTFLEIKLFTG